MIQRIQTLFLLVAAICIALTWFMPVLKIVGIPFTLAEIPEVGFQAILIASGAVSLISIFLYKNRSLQKKAANLALVLIFAAIGYFLGANGFNFKGLGFAPGAALLLLSAINLYFAQQAIQKDENLVKSADRFR